MVVDGSQEVLILQRRRGNVKDFQRWIQGRRRRDILLPFVAVVESDAGRRLSPFSWPNPPVDLLKRPKELAGVVWLPAVVFSEV